MANKFIIILHEGQLVKRTVRKPDAPRNLKKWVRYAATEALSWKARHFVFRFHGKWHVFDALGDGLPVAVERLLKTFDEQTAAEMYLLTKGLT